MTDLGNGKGGKELVSAFVERVHYENCIPREIGAGVLRDRKVKCSDAVYEIISRMLPFNPQQRVTAAYDIVCNSREFLE